MINKKIRQNNNDHLQNILTQPFNTRSPLALMVSWHLGENFSGVNFSRGKFGENVRWEFFRVDVTKMCISLFSNYSDSGIT